MKTTLALVFFAFFGFIGLNAQELNLLNNPSFLPGPYGEKVDGWSVNGKFSVLPKAGPDGENVLRLEERKGTLRQSSIRLLEGEEYRIGAWIRTTDFNSEWAVFGFWNYGWTKAAYTPELTDTHGEWMKIEAVAKAPWSRNKHYEFGFHSSAWEGTLEIASPFLIPESKRAKAEQQALNAPVPLDFIPMIQVARTTIVDTPPVLDGVLDDEVWQKAFSMDDFAVFKTGKAPVAKTEVKLLSDANAIYLGISCHEPDSICDPGETEGSKVWKADLVEIFFGAKSPERRHSQFVVGVNECTYTGDGKDTAATLNGRKHINNLGPWKAKVSQKEGCWFAEVRIPFETLGWQTHGRGAAIPFNISRQRVTGKEVVTWSRCILRKFNETTHFGRLVLGSYGEAFQLKYHKPLSAENREVFEQEAKREEEALTRATLDAQGKRVLLAPVSAMDDFHLPYFPKELLSPPKKIALKAAINEWKALPLAVFNNTDRPQEYRVVVEAGDTRWLSHQLAEGLVDFPKVTMREAIPFRLDQNGGKAILDPLPKMNELRSILVPPRQTGVVWIDFDTSDVAPGNYTGRILAIPLGGEGRFKPGTMLNNPYKGDIVAVPVELTVQDITLPKNPPYEMSLYSGIPLELSALEQFEAMGCHSFNISIWYLIFPKDDNRHFKLEAKKAEEMITFIQRECDRRGYRPFFPITYSAISFFERMYGENHLELWKEWVRTVDAFMAKMNVKKGEWWIELLDEPWAKEMEKVNIYAKAAREAVPDFPLAMTTVAGRLTSPKDLEMVFPYISTWIFHRGDFNAGQEWFDFIQKTRKSGIDVGHYTCEVEMDSSLAENYRRTAWFTEFENLPSHHLYQGFRYNYEQCGKDFKIAQYGTLFYMSFHDAIPSLRSMAVRQGVMDMKYLAVLRELAPTHPEVAEFLKKAVQRVVIDFPHVPAMPDIVREETAELILKLKK